MEKTTQCHAMSSPPTATTAQHPPSKEEKCKETNSLGGEQHFEDASSSLPPTSVCKNVEKMEKATPSYPPVEWGVDSTLVEKPFPLSNKSTTSCEDPSPPSGGSYSTPLLVVETLPLLEESPPLPLGEVGVCLDKTLPNEASSLNNEEGGLVTSCGGDVGGGGNGGGGGVGSVGGGDISGGDAGGGDVDGGDAGVGGVGGGDYTVETQPADTPPMKTRSSNNPPSKTPSTKTFPSNPPTKKSHMNTLSTSPPTTKIIPTNSPNTHTRSTKTVPSTPPTTSDPPTTNSTITTTPTTNPSSTNSPTTSARTTNPSPNKPLPTKVFPSNPSTTKILPANSSTTNPPTTKRTTTTNPATTDPPITSAPTTNSPTMNSPTTEPPNTNPPTTNTPVTNPLNTDAPITNTPITNTPTTSPPKTSPPTTSPPTTHPPTTHPPTINPPTAGTPVTNPLNTDAPIINTPTTSPPTTSPPTTSPPTTSPPTTHLPTAGTPVTNSLNTDGPIINPRITNTPITNTPTTHPPTTNPPTINPPTINPPTTNPPTAGTPTTSPRNTDTPTTNPPTVTNPPYTNDTSTTSNLLSTSNTPITNTSPILTNNSPTTDPPTTNTPITNAPPTIAKKLTTSPTSPPATTSSPPSTTNPPSTITPPTTTSPTSINNSPLPTTPLPTTASPPTEIPTSHETPYSPPHALPSLLVENTSTPLGDSPPPIEDFLLSPPASSLQSSLLVSEAAKKPSHTQDEDATKTKSSCTSEDNSVNSIAEGVCDGDKTKDKELEAASKELMKEKSEAGLSVASEKDEATVVKDAEGKQQPVYTVNTMLSVYLQVLKKGKTSTEDIPNIECRPVPPRRFPETSQLSPKIPSENRVGGVSLGMSSAGPSHSINRPLNLFNPEFSNRNRRPVRHSIHGAMAPTERPRFANSSQQPSTHFNEDATSSLIRKDGGLRHFPGKFKETEGAAASERQVMGGLAAEQPSLATIHKEDSPSTQDPAKLKGSSAEEDERPSSGLQHTGSTRSKAVHGKQGDDSTVRPGRPAGLVSDLHTHRSGIRNKMQYGGDQWEMPLSDSSSNWSHSSNIFSLGDIRSAEAAIASGLSMEEFTRDTLEKMRKKSYPHNGQVSDVKAHPHVHAHARTASSLKTDHSKEGVAGVHAPLEKGEGSSPEGGAFNQSLTKDSHLQRGGLIERKGKKAGNEAKQFVGGTDAVKEPGGFNLAEASLSEGKQGEKTPSITPLPGAFHAPMSMSSKDGDANKGSAFMSEANTDELQYSRFARWFKSTEQLPTVPPTQPTSLVPKASSPLRGNNEVVGSDRKTLMSLFSSKEGESNDPNAMRKPFSEQELLKIHAHQITSQKKAISVLNPPPVESPLKSRNEAGREAGKTLMAMLKVKAPPTMTKPPQDFASAPASSSPLGQHTTESSRHPPSDAQSSASAFSAPPQRAPYAGREYGIHHPQLAKNSHPATHTSTFSTHGMMPHTASSATLEASSSQHMQIPPLETSAKLSSSGTHHLPSNSPPSLITSAAPPPPFLTFPPQNSTKNPFLLNPSSVASSSTYYPFKGVFEESSTMLQSSLFDTLEAFSMDANEEATRTFGDDEGRGVVAQPPPPGGKRITVEELFASTAKQGCRNLENFQKQQLLNISRRLHFENEGVLPQDLYVGPDSRHVGLQEASRKGESGGLPAFSSEGEPRKSFSSLQEMVMERLPPRDPPPPNGFSFGNQYSSFPPRLGDGDIDALKAPIEGKGGYSRSLGLLYSHLGEARGMRTTANSSAHTPIPHPPGVDSDSSTALNSIARSLADDEAAFKRVQETQKLELELRNYHLFLRHKNSHNGKLENAESQISHENPSRTPASPLAQHTTPSEGAVLSAYHGGGGVSSSGGRKGGVISSSSPAPPPPGRDDLFKRLYASQNEGNFASNNSANTTNAATTTATNPPPPFPSLPAAASSPPCGVGAIPPIPRSGDSSGGITGKSSSEHISSQHTLGAYSPQHLGEQGMSSTQAQQNPHSIGFPPRLKHYAHPVSRPKVYHGGRNSVLPSYQGEPGLHQENNVLSYHTHPLGDAHSMKVQAGAASRDSGYLMPPGIMGGGGEAGGMVKVGDYFLPPPRPNQMGGGGALGGPPHKFNPPVLMHSAPPASSYLSWGGDGVDSLLSSGMGRGEGFGGGDHHLSLSAVEEMRTLNSSSSQKMGAAVRTQHQRISQRLVEPSEVTEELASPHPPSGGGRTSEPPQRGEGGRPRYNASLPFQSSSDDPPFTAPHTHMGNHFNNTTPSDDLRATLERGVHYNRDVGGKGGGHSTFMPQQAMPTEQLNKSNNGGFHRGVGYHQMSDAAFIRGEGEFMTTAQQQQAVMSGAEAGGRRPYIVGALDSLYKGHKHFPHTASPRQPKYSEGQNYVGMLGLPYTKSPL